MTSQIHIEGTVTDVLRDRGDEVLFPALARLPGVDLPGLVDDVDVLLGGGVLHTGWDYLEEGPERWRVRISRLRDVPGG